MLEINNQQSLGYESVIKLSLEGYGELKHYISKHFSCKILMIFGSMNGSMMDGYSWYPLFVNILVVIQDL